MNEYLRKPDTWRKLYLQETHLSMSLWQKETLTCVFQAFPSADTRILDKMRLYLCVMKVCTVHGVLQPRDDEAKSKWAGLTVHCRVAFPESCSWVTGEGEFKLE